jgi:hypothetical protein
MRGWDSVSSGFDPVTDFCENENELSVSMKSRNFLTSLFTPLFYAPPRTLTIFTTIPILLYYFLFVSLSSLSALVKHPLHLSAISVWAFYILTSHTLFRAPAAPN